LAIPGPVHFDDLVTLLRSRQAPIEIRRYAARGVLPLDATDRLRALIPVLRDSEPEIAATAGETFAQIPPDDLADFLLLPDVLPAEIDSIASRTDDVLVLERLMRHRNVSDATLADLARTVSGTAQEALVVNQARLLRNPALIAALFENPALTGDSRRVLNELKEEFFEKETRRREARRVREKPVESQPPAEAPQPSAQDAEEPEEEPEPPAAPAAEAQEASPGAEEIYIRIMGMTVPERVKLALTGGREERRLLIADGSRMVGFAVLRARGLTITEIEGYCGMRHLEPEIFTKIAMKRDWVRRPLIALALVKNPKVPLYVSLPLIRRLQMRDLRNIFRDRNLPDAVRAMARKTYMERRR
jgi:hypothetical protein